LLEEFSDASTCSEEVGPVRGRRAGGGDEDSPAEVRAIAAVSELTVAVEEGGAQDIDPFCAEILWPSTDAAVGGELDWASTTA